MHHDLPFLLLASGQKMPDMALHYDARLVLLSWLVACVAAILALQQADMATRMQRRALRLGMVLSGAMVLGMLPTALGLGEGAAPEQGLAVVILGGLLWSALRSTNLIPALYLHWRRKQLARAVRA